MVEVTTDSVESSFVIENDADKYNSILAVHQALMQKPGEFKDTINHLLADRLETAVEKKREEVARSIFDGQEPEVQANDSAPEEVGQEETVESEPEVEESTAATEEEETEVIPSEE